MNSAQKIIKVFAIGLALFIIVSILEGIFFALRLMGGFGYSSSNEFYQSTFQNVQKVEMDLNASDVTIEIGTEFKIEANQVSKKFLAKEKNGTLKIEENGKWFFGGYPSGEIILTVPANITLEDLKINAGAGKISISGIKSKRLDLDQGAGVLNITNSIFDETDIDGGAGLLEITSSTLRNLDFDAGVGKVLIEGNIYGKSKIDCGIGELNLNLKNKSDYTIYLEKGIGSIEIEKTEYSNKSFGSGSNILDIEGGIGSIKINFES